MNGTKKIFYSGSLSARSKSKHTESPNNGSDAIIIYDERDENRAFPTVPINTNIDFNKAVAGKLPGFIIMGHELIHAIHYAQARLAKGKVDDRVGVLGHDIIDDREEGFTMGIPVYEKVNFGTKEKPIYSYEIVKPLDNYSEIKLLRENGYNFKRPNHNAMPIELW